MQEKRSGWGWFRRGAARRSASQLPPQETPAPRSWLGRMFRSSNPSKVVPSTQPVPEDVIIIPPFNLQSINSPRDGTQDPESPLALSPRIMQTLQRLNEISKEKAKLAREMNEAAEKIVSFVQNTLYDHIEELKKDLNKTYADDQALLKEKLKAVRGFESVCHGVVRNIRENIQGVSKKLERLKTDKEQAEEESASLTRLAKMERRLAACNRELDALKNGLKTPAEIASLSSRLGVETKEGLLDALESANKAAIEESSAERVKIYTRKFEKDMEEVWGKALSNINDNFANLAKKSDELFDFFKGGSLSIASYGILKQIDTAINRTIRTKWGNEGTAIGGIVCDYADLKNESKELKKHIEKSEELRTLVEASIGLDEESEQESSRDPIQRRQKTQDPLSPTSPQGEKGRESRGKSPPPNQDVDENSDVNLPGMPL
jgi:hypothetical protein